MSTSKQYTFADRFRTVKAWELQKTENSIAPEGIWTNEDMEPIPPFKCTWTTLTFAGYWASDLLNAGSWSTVSSFVSLGLTWWESVIAVFLGAAWISIILAGNGIIGSRIHTPFAITSRASLGYSFAKFAVVSRMVIAWFWFSINTYLGGNGIAQMIIAMAPGFRYMPNYLPASAGVTSSSMLCFFIFWALQFPLCLIHPSKLRWLFLAKAIILPVVGIATMAWSISAAGDARSTVLNSQPTVSGAQHFAAFMIAVTASGATWSTMALSVGDFSRYSKKETAAGLQIVFMPLLFGVTSIFGAITSNMTQAIYGELLWQPFDLADKWQGTPGGRAAAFLTSAAWVLGNMGTNISANSISSANDMCTLAPRWINILRGQLFAVFVGCWAFAPWKVLATAGSFISFMGSYAIVLAPMASILFTDFFFVKKGKYDVPALYDPHSPIYSYGRFGINWRALVALLCAFGVCLPGMVNALNPDINIGNISYVYACANIVGVVLAGGIHVTLSKLFPDRDSYVPALIKAEDYLAERDSGVARSVSGSKEDEKDDLAESHVVSV